MDIIQLKRGKLSEWTAENPVLEAGEAGIVFDTETLVPIGLKVGNGFLTFNELPFITGGGSVDTYTREEIDEMIGTLGNQFDVLQTSVEAIQEVISQQASVSDKVLARSEVESLIAAAGLNPTPEQLAAMNSGITSEVLQQLLTATASIPTKISDLTNDSDFATDSDVAAVQSDLDSHKENTSNPHNVTKGQVGLDKVANVLQYSEDNPPPYPVNSVNGKSGTVVLNKSDVGLGNVDNTSDANKPISVAQAAVNTSVQNSLNSKQPAISGQLNYPDLLMTPPSSDGGQPGVINKSVFANASDVAASLAGKVDKVAGKVLSDNNYTTEEKTKLQGIAAGAEVNVIAEIKLNGSTLTPTGKVVDLGSLETSADAAALAGRVSSLESSVDTKASKVASATENNFAGLDASGNLKDSGKKASDFATAAQGALAATALQPTNVDSGFNSASENPVQNKVIAVLIPTQASAENQLADKEFVNSSIMNLSADYITKDAQGNPFETKAQLLAAQTFYCNGQVKTTLTQNDYCMVLADESKAEYISEIPSVYQSWTTTAEYEDYFVDVGVPAVKTKVTSANKDSLGITPGVTVPYSQVLPTSRYTYQDLVGWVFQYIINNSGLTANQLAAVNSGITGALVGKLNNIEAGAQVNTVNSVNGKTGAVALTASDVGLGSVVNTGDSNIPTSGGTTKFTTGGAYTELAKKQDKIDSSNKLSADLISDGSTNKVFTATEKSKLSGIAEGAQVNILDGVQVGGTDLSISGKKVNIATEGTYDASNNKFATMSAVRDNSSGILAQTLRTGVLRDTTLTESSLGQIKFSDNSVLDYLVSNVNLEFEPNNSGATPIFRPVELKINNENASIDETIISNFIANYRSVPNETGAAYIFLTNDTSPVNYANIAPNNITLLDSHMILKVPTGYHTGTYNIRNSNIKLSFGTPQTDGFPENQLINVEDSIFTFTYNRDDSNDNEQLVLNCQNSEIHIYDKSNHANSTVYYKFWNCIDTKVYLHGKAQVEFVGSVSRDGVNTTFSHAGAEIILCSDYEYTPYGMFYRDPSQQTFEIPSIRVIDEVQIGPYTKSIIASGDTASISNSGSWSGDATNGYSATIEYEQHRKGYNGDKYFPKVKTYSRTTTSNVFEEVYDSATINISDGSVTIYSDADTPEYLVVIE